MKIYRINIVRICLFFILYLFTYCSIKGTDKYNPKKFNIHIGVNLSNWFERNDLSSEQLANYIDHHYLLKVKQMGFDHVRIPVNEELLFTSNLEYRQKYWNVLIDRVDFCHSVGLKTIVDLHSSRVYNRYDKSLFLDHSSLMYFLRVWMLMQDRFKHYSHKMLAYEMLNEPNVVEKMPNSLNEIFNRWIKLIRKVEPKRFLIIGANGGYRPWRVKYLDLPKDPYLVLTYHTYTPGVLTHYATTWSEFRDYTYPVKYPGKVIEDKYFNKLNKKQKERFSIYNAYFDKSYLQDEINSFIDFAKSHNLQMYCGEFGCQRSVPDSSRYRWFGDIVSVFEENGIAYTMWGFRDTGFGLWNDTGVLDREQLKLITKKNYKGDDN